MTSYQEHLILKFLKKEINSDEFRTLEEWINESVENKKMFEDFKFIWHLSGKDEVRDFETETEWVKLEASLYNKETSVRALNEPNFSWFKIAASVSILFLSSFILYISLKTEINTHEAANKTLRFDLPDGSTVWLNHNSKLTYNESDFNDEGRVVQLSGEGFFKVNKNPNKPFVVQTEHSEVKVLGTSFNVKAYHNDDLTKVFVVTGLVGFSNNENKGNTIKLKPGETGILNISKNIIAKVDHESLNAVAWKEKRLMFKKTSLNEVVETIHNYFNINVEVTNQNLLDCRFTSTFDNPNLEEVLEALSVSLDITIQHNDNSYILNGGECK